MTHKVFGISLEKGLWGRLIYPLLSTLLVLALIAAVAVSLRFLLGIQNDILEGTAQGGAGAIESFNLDALKPIAPRLGIDPETLKPIPE